MISLFAYVLLGWAFGIALNVRRDLKGLDRLQANRKRHHLPPAIDVFKPFRVAVLCFAAILALTGAAILGAI